MCDMHEIQPGLWLGSYHAASDLTTLAERGVTHVLTVGLKDKISRLIGSRQRLRIQPSEYDRFTRLLVDSEDQPSFRLDKHFEACSAFISEALAAGTGILVHCVAGQSRSPAVVIAHLMRQEKWSLDHALDYVRSRRPLVCPNIGFLDQLRSFESRFGLGSKQLLVLEEVSPSGVALVDASDCMTRECDSETSPCGEVVSDESGATVDDHCLTAERCEVSLALPVHSQQSDFNGDMFGTKDVRRRLSKLQGLCNRHQLPNLLSRQAPGRKRRHT